LTWLIELLASRKDEKQAELLVRLMERAPQLIDSVLQTPYQRKCTLDVAPQPTRIL
jgi:hypothetical protein